MQIFREIPFFILVSDFPSSVELETAGVCSDTSLVRIDLVIVILCCVLLLYAELPRSEGVRCVSENWQGLRCTWTLTTGTQTWSHYTADGCLVSYSYPCE